MRSLRAAAAAALLCLPLACAPNQAELAPGPPFRVLLTGFDPFGGRPENNSQSVVTKLGALAEQMGPGVVVKVCILPTIYDRGAEAALACAREFHPDAVVSLGEAACTLRLETAATNRDRNLGRPDNAGQMRDATPIIAGDPERSGFNFPVEAMYCALAGQASPIPLEISRSPGEFVCNNVAYHLSRKLGALGVPFTFIHVPNGACPVAVKDPARNAQMIARMLRGAFAAIRARGAGAGMPEVEPRTKQEALDLSARLQRTLAPECETRFARELISAY